MYAGFIFRRRPSLEENNSALNKSLVQQFEEVPGFWRPDAIGISPPFSLLEGHGSLDLRRARKVLVEGLGGQVRYCARFPGWIDQDISMCDDTLMFAMDTIKVDYTEFCRVTLQKLIDIFGPYRVSVRTDETVEMADWEITRVQSNETKRDVDGRDSVHRIWPVCFIDNLLCQRSFGMSAAEVVARVAPECERAELLYGGAFLIVTTNIITGSDLDVLNTRIMSRLTPRSVISGSCDLPG